MLAPKLRFKEFDGDWLDKKIGSIASKIGSGSTPRGGSKAYTDSGIIFIRSQNVNNDQLLLDDVAYIPETTHSKMSGSKVIENDILLNITGASIGRSCVVPHDFIEANVNQHVCIIRTPNDDPIFVQSFLSSENGQNAIQSKQAGGGREGLNFQAIRSIDFHFPPSKAEQTKIASFLSAVDEKISQLSQKLHLLDQYKQGMMQKLFSQQIRFKADDGSELEEWTINSLEDIAEIIGGGTPSTKNKEYWNGTIAWLTPSEINTKYISQSKRTISELGAQKSSAKKLPLGTILFTSRATIGEVAISKAEVTTNQGFQSFVVKENISNEFLYYWIIQNKQKFIERASGSTFLEISKSKIQPMKILLPCLEEQTKIANFLSAIDQKIDAAAEQLEQAKTWKKGLLQQMFV